MKDLIKVQDKQTYRTQLGSEADEVIIGDEKSASFVPKITLTRWQKENSISFRYDVIDGTPTLSAGQVKVANASQEFYAQPFDENTLKFGVNFLTKPASNKVIPNLATELSEKGKIRRIEKINERMKKGGMK